MQYLRPPYLIAPVLGALTILMACQSGVDPTRPLEALPRNLSTAEQAVIAGSNNFAFELLRAVNDGQERENVFVSPLSISMALGMTMNGAVGPSFDEIRSTLGFEGVSQTEINAAYSDLLRLLTGLDRSVDIQLGNSLWYRRGLPFEQSFFDTVRRGFGARVEGLDFEDPAAVGRINGWVNDATRGRIDSIVDRIPDDAVMYLINAIYFKGRWTDRFDPAATRTDRFTGLDGEQRDVRLMSRDGRYRYGRTDGLEVLDLPYGNGAFSMTILLPAEGRNVNDILVGLDAGEWATILDGLTLDRLFVEVPRFRLEYERSLKDPLMAMGIQAAFTPGRSDFSGMSASHGKDLVITEVKHKTFVEVNEEGTEAAAATSVEIGIVSMPPTFRVDRPFLFAIRERFSGTILFVGKIVSPEAASG